MPDLRTLEITIDFNQDGPSLCCDLINVAENTVTVGMLKYLIICVSVWSLCFCIGRWRGEQKKSLPAGEGNNSAILFVVVT